MKPNRDATALAAALTNAATSPLPLPERAPQPEPPARSQAPRPKKTGRPKVTETVGITLRPARELLVRYTNAAADRTKKEGRVVSAQEIMLEVLDRSRT